MSKFQVGDLVEVIQDYEEGKYVGCVFTVQAIAIMQNPGDNRIAKVNIVDEPVPPECARPGRVIAFEDFQLRKVDDGDCYEKTEWDESIFKPRELVRIEHE